MKVVQTNLKDIKPYSKNPRNNKDAVDEVAKSIQNFGFVQPLVLDKKNIIVIGHTRFLAAQKLKLKKVPVVFANDLSPKKVRSLRIADNKTGEISTWDFDLLKIELDGLDNMFTGFSKDELKNLLGDIDDILKEQTYLEKFNLIIECKDEVDQQRIYERLTKEGLKCQVQSL